MSNILHIHNQFGDYLFNFIKSKVSSIDDAKDIYQEVIYKIMNKSSQLYKAESLKSWLFTIARNQIIDYYRTRKTIVDLEVVSTNQFSIQDEINSYGKLEGCLLGFINQLPEEYRSIITLSEIDGKSQKELSESLGINYVTLRSKVQRGRERIKKMILESCTIDQDHLGGLVACTPKSAAPACKNKDEDCE